MQPKLNISLRQIAYFKAIGEVGSFRGAAERLGVTQPTLTAQIATLEESLGVKLFERTRLGATPTVAARELIPVCNRIQEEVQSFVDTRTASRVENGNISHWSYANAGALPAASGVTRNSPPLSGTSIVCV